MSGTQAEVPAPRWSTWGRVDILSQWQAALAFGLYAGFALWLTWPMAKDPADLFYGAPGDPFGSMAVLREMVEEGRPPFLPGVLSDFSAPDGLEIAWVRGLASLPSSLLLYLLGTLFGPVVAYNLFALIAAPVTGLATFLLARRLTGDPWAAAVAGWAFAFFPFAVQKGFGHYELAHGWVVVLVVWRVLVLSEQPSVRNGVLAGVATVFGMAWSAYFILIVGVAYAALLIGTVVITARRRTLRTQLRGQSVAAGFVLAYLVVFYALGTAAPAGQGLREHSVAQLNAYSARPYEYVVPNAAHPLVGDATGPWLAERLHGSNASESTLYLGISMLLLAVCGVVAASRRKVSPSTARAVLLLSLMGLAGAWVSAPPRGMVLGVNVPFPSELISDVAPTWRVYARLVVVVMLAASLIGAIGLAALARRGAAWQRAAIVAAVAVVVVVDLLPRQFGVSPLGPQPIHSKLAQMPDGIVAVYPLTESLASYGSLWDQGYHDHPLINGYEPGSADEARALRLADPSRPGTAQGLAAIGTRYVLVPAVPENAAMRFPRRDYRLVAQDASGAIYELRPGGRGPAVAAFTTHGFGPAEQAKGGLSYWLQQAEGTIEADGACRRCRGTLSAVLESFGRPRDVTLRDESGRVLVRRRVTGPTALAVPLRFDRRTELTITATPGPLAVSEVVPGAVDPRALSINVSALRLEPAAPASPGG